MGSIQDKDLQEKAFEIFKSKEISVEDSYKLALDFLKVKKNRNGLDIVEGIEVREYCIAKGLDPDCI